MANSNIADFTSDDRNFNKHTSKGMDLLKKSIEHVGVIESFTVSKDNKIISGNARQEKMSEVLGDIEPIIIETDGSRPVVLKRTDINGGTKKFYEAALLANTVSIHNIDLNDDLIKEVAIDEFDIDVSDIGVELFLEGDNDPFGEFEELGEFSYVNKDVSAWKQLIVSFRSKEDYEEFSRITGLSLTEKTKSTFFPMQEKEKIEDIYE